MKRLTIGFVLALMMASVAVAGQIQVGYSGSSYGIYQYDKGGEFTYNPLTGWLNLSGYDASKTANIGVSGTFQTFCIEGAEYLYGYDNIYDAQISTKAMNGGVTPAGVGDPISVGTGWLYSQFARGVLAGYNYSGTEAQREYSADLLQKAIWWLEGEKGIAYNAGNTFMFEVYKNFSYDEAAAKADGGEQYGVYAINMSQNGEVRQDALYYVPDGGSTAILLGLAFAGMQFIIRRRRIQ